MLILNQYNDLKVYERRPWDERFVGFCFSDHSPGVTALKPAPLSSTAKSVQGELEFL